MSGPIIRITPEELHIQDVDFYDVLYSRENKLDKFPGQITMFGIQGSHFATAPHDLHKLRRAPLTPYFSRKFITDMSNTTHERIEALCRRMRDYQACGEPMPLGLGFVAMTTDIISGHALGDCYNLLERKDFGIDHHHNIIGFIHSCHFIKHWTSLFFFMRNLRRRYQIRITCRHLLSSRLVRTLLLV